MRICFIYRWENPVMAQVRELLKAEGATVDVIYPEKTPFINLTDLRVDYDLYLLKSGADSLLTLAGMLHMMGAKIINPYPPVAMMRDKFVVMCALQAAGVPIPETYMASGVNDLQPLLKDGPLIIKPYRGSRGIGIKVVHHADDMKNLADQQILAQRYHTPDDSDGRFHKIFCIGDQIFGSKRIWPLRKYEDKMGEPYVISPEIKEIAYKIGEIFGITLYGADIVISDGRPYVVDVNTFGSFMGVPNAPKRLVEHIRTLV